MIISTTIFIYSIISTLLTVLEAHRPGDVHYVGTHVTFDIFHIPNTTSAKVEFRVREIGANRLKTNNFFTLKYRLEYWQLTTDLLIHQPEKKDREDCTNSIDDINEHGSREKEHCDADVYEFGYFDEDANTATQKRWTSRCKMHEWNFTEDATIILNDLWPYSKYAFKYSIIADDYTTLEGPTPLTDYPFCLPKYIPLGPPQTDNNAFELEYMPNGNRYATLYWRPVPHLFYGDEFLNITVNCTQDHDNGLFFKLDLSNSDYGKYRIPNSIPSNWSITCEFRSYNSVGPSATKSYIRIPIQKKILKIHDSFTLEDVNYSKGYKVRWNDTRYPPKPRTQFTLYWCTKMISLGCNSLKGIYRTLRYEQTVRKLVSPNEASFQYRFGIAFEDLVTGERSAIYWQRDCDLLELRHLPLIITGIQASRVETGFHIAWMVGNCGKSPLIDYYTYDLCFLEVHHPCTTMVQFSKNSFKERVNFGDKNRCIHITFDNDLKSKADIFNLQSHSYYALRMKYHIPEQHWSNWSEIEIGSTSYESSKSTECLTRIVTSVMILGPLITTSAYYLYRVYRHRIYGRFSTKNTLKIAVSSIPDQLVRTFNSQEANCGPQKAYHPLIIEEDDDDTEQEECLKVQDDFTKETNDDHANSIPYIRPESMIGYIAPDSMGIHDDEAHPFREETSNSMSEIYAQESNDTDEEAFIDGVLRITTKSFLPTSE